MVATSVSALLRALAVCLAIALWGAPAARAESDGSEMLTAPIVAQPVSQALDALAQQTGLHVVYVSGVVHDQTSQAVPAGLNAREALARLLEGTGLKFEFFTARSVRILADERAAGQLPPGPHDSSSLPSVIITGSRIAVPANITATSPLVVVTAQDIVLAGYTGTGDVIRALPQITMTGVDSGNYSANGWGTATANLRGLGPQRTVVLVNGRRLGLGDPNTAHLNTAPDLDQIPLPMIERVEVLTGGAAAVYGSDAVAGVVNFILKEHVQGVQIDAQYGFAQHVQHSYYLQRIETAQGIAHPTGTTIDGFTRDVSVLAGTGFHDDAGHVTAYFVYHGQNPLYGSDRDFSACTGATANWWNDDPTQRGLTCAMSANSNFFLPNAGDADTAYSVVGNQFVPRPAAGAVPPSRFNFAADQSLQRESGRYQAGLLAHVELSRAAAPYMELSFMDDRSELQGAPAGLFISANHLTFDGNYLVNCSNPLLSAQEATILCTPAEIATDRSHPGDASADVVIGRRNIEGGPRVFTYVHKSHRAVAGIGGNLGDALSYDAHALYFRTSLSNAYQGVMSLTAINNALQVTTDQSGRPVCISGGDCVPYNIFKTGAVSAQQLAYLTRSGIDGGDNSEQIIEADVTAQLGRYGLIAPWAHEGVAFNAGAEHRLDTLQYAPNAAELSHDLIGVGPGTVPVNNRVSVNEAFVEIRVPVAQYRPLVNDLTVGAGYRYSVYSTTGAARTYKVDLQFAPVTDMRIRTSFDHVVRAPNLIELYTPLAYNSLGEGSLDPCAPVQGQPATATLAQCMHMGVTAAQYGNGGSTNTITQCPGTCGVTIGGNPALAPETADTWSLGVTLTPTTIPTLTASIDYFHILLKGAIGTIPDSVTIEQCAASGDPTWCSQIVRTSAGALFGSNVAAGGYTVGRFVNTGTDLVSGVDVQANYRQLLPGRRGALTASLNGSWLQHNSSTPYRSATSYDCAGLFGRLCLSGSANPTWRHNLRVTWEMPWALQLSAQWRFIGRTGFGNNSSQIPLRKEEGFYNPDLTHLSNYSYLDLAADWDVTGHLQLRGGVNNVFDKDPPFIPSVDVSTNAAPLNTYPTYDIVGREVFLALRATF